MRSIQVFVTGAGVHCIYAVRSVKELDGFEFSIATFFFHKMQVETCGSLLDIGQLDILIDGKLHISRHN